MEYGEMEGLWEGQWVFVILGLDNTGIPSLDTQVPYQLRSLDL